MISYGLAEGLNLKTFYDYNDGNAEYKANKFFNENPTYEILDIKYHDGYSIMPVAENDTYGRSYVMVIYRIK